MKFCKNCGHELNEEAKFCKSCGAPVDSSVPNHTQHEPVQENSTPKKAKMDKKKLWIILPIIFVVLAGVFIGGYFLGESLFGKQSQLENIRTAIETNDEEALKSLLTSENGMQDTYYHEFASYFQDHPDRLDHLISDLEKEMNEEGDASALIDPVEEGKTFYLYPQYHFEVEPVTIMASANFEQTEVHIPGYEAFQTEQAGEQIPVDVLPGKYTVTFLHREKYGSFDQTVTLDFWQANQDQLEASVAFEGNVVEIESNYPEAELIVNGKAQGTTIEETSSYGPVTYDGTTYLAALLEFPWETYYSNEVTITSPSQQKVALEFEWVEDDLKEAIYSRIAQHTNEWIQAYHKTSIREFTVMKNEEYLESTRANFERMENDDSHFEGDIERIRIDDGSFTFENTTASVIAELEFYSGYYESGQYDELERSRDTYYWLYEFEYDQEAGNWFIMNSEELSDFETDDIINYE
ncbi:hypothetical protein J416_12092 [Gracilibacillus halophilus YIM-C55.5]|uniref:Uncharacterized protein n=1 Tax=Gracilibacillus halophilus YIM-C55.5 TaxID=1308866 RepID=N4WAD8_9BACI|nr:zinc-ribbon domain-containing protein [Gracilibacillus halophilus]ENH96244.1 hypothetical protein J416_12092 [Gracilibacillus halophilus YIM-C55.5]